MQYNIELISENPVYTELQIDTDRSLFAGCAVLTYGPQPDVGVCVMLGVPSGISCPGVFLYTHTATCL